MGLRKVYVIGKLATVSMFDYSFTTEEEISTLYRFSVKDVRKWFDFEERLPTLISITDRHYKAFKTLTEAEDYATQSVTVTDGGSTNNASAVFHVTVTETAELSPVFCGTYHSNVCKPPHVLPDEKSFLSHTGGPTYILLDLKPHDIISIDRATFNKNKLGIAVHPDMQDIDLELKQQYKYEQMAEFATNTREACKNMLCLYRARYCFVLFRSKDKPIKEIEALLKKDATTNFALNELLSKLQQQVPKEQWDGEFYGMITAMKVVINKEFKVLTTNLLQKALPNSLADMVLQYTGSRRVSKELPASKAIYSVSVQPALFKSLTNHSSSSSSSTSEHKKFQVYAK